MRQYCERVEKMLAHHGTRFANCRQVVAPIPFRQQRHVSEQLIMHRRGQREIQFCDAALERGTRRHAVFLDGCKPLFKCTSSREIAAGVIPEMRDAWPMLSGLC